MSVLQRLLQKLKGSSQESSTYEERSSSSGGQPDDDFAPFPTEFAEESNEQPTAVNSTALAAVIVAIAFLIVLALWLIPGSSDTVIPEEDVSTQTSSPRNARRAAPPGVTSDGSNNFDPSTWGEDEFDVSPEESLTPRERARLRAERSDQSNQSRRAYLDSLIGRTPNGNGSAAPRSRSLNRPRTDAYRPPNPSTPAAQSQRSDPQRLQKAMVSAVSTPLDPPGQFDPRSAGSPRHPASGRPLGQPPTPEELEQETDFRSQNSPSTTSYREQMGDRYPVRRSLSRSEQFLEEQRSRGFTDEEVSSVQGPLSPFVLPKGTIIPVTLETGANNNLPGTTIMRIARDVYDRSKQYVLIPRGSEVVSTYSTASESGQDRILIAANRLNLPDGRFLNFRDTRATDVSGYAGLADQKDRHLFSKFASAGALAILSATVAITDPLAGIGRAQRDTSRSGAEIIVAPNPTLGARATAGFSQQVADIIARILDQSLSRKPTLKLRPGLRGLLLLNEDIDLEVPYYEAGDDFEQMDSRFETYRQDRDVRRTQRQLEKERDYYRYQETLQRIQDERQHVHQIGRERGYRASSVDLDAPFAPGAASPQYYYEEGRYAEELPTYLPPRGGMTPREAHIRTRYMGGEGMQGATVRSGAAYSNPNAVVPPNDASRTTGSTGSSPPNP